MCVYTYCLYTCIYIYTHILTHIVCIYIHTYIHIYIYTYIHIYIYTYIHIYTYIYSYTHIHIYLYIHTHSRAGPGASNVRQALQCRHFATRGTAATQPLATRRPHPTRCQTTPHLLCRVCAWERDCQILHEFVFVRECTCAVVCMHVCACARLSVHVVDVMCVKYEHSWWLRLGSHGGSALGGEWRQSVGAAFSAAPFSPLSLRRPARLSIMDVLRDLFVYNFLASFIRLISHILPCDVAGRYLCHGSFMCVKFRCISSCFLSCIHVCVFLCAHVCVSTCMLVSSK